MFSSLIPGSVVDSVIPGSVVDAVIPGSVVDAVRCPMTSKSLQDDVKLWTKLTTGNYQTCNY